MDAILNETDKTHIRDRIRKLAPTPAPSPAPVVVAPPVLEPKKRDHIATVFLGTVMFLLSIVLMLGVIDKLKAKYPTEEFDYAYNEQQYQQESVVPDTRDTSRIFDDVEKLKAVAKQQSHQLWVLSLQGNQNAAVSKHMDAEFHKGRFSNRFVLIQENWKLDKNPDTIQFSEESLKRLQDHINVPKN